MPQDIHVVYHSHYRVIVGQKCRKCYKIYLVSRYFTAMKNYFLLRLSRELKMRAHEMRSVHVY